MAALEAFPIRGRSTGPTLIGIDGDDPVGGPPPSSQLLQDDAPVAYEQVLTEQAAQEALDRIYPGDADAFC